MKIGDRYGRWLVLSEPYAIEGKNKRVDVVCDCGTRKSVRVSSLLSGDSTSCRCFAKETARERMSTKGGESKHSLHQRWYDLNRRCYDPRRKDYKHYGGRGIEVCEEWHKDNPEGFQNFLKDMESTHKPKLEIDRIDNDGNYCKENCKWSTRSEQVLNSRYLGSKVANPRYLDDGEDVLHLAAMARKHGLNERLLQDRIGKLGMSVQEALSLPVKTRQYFLIFDGNEYSLKDVFTNICHFINLRTRIKASTEQLIYYVFGDNVRVEGLVNKNRVVFEKVNLDLSGFTFKLPTVFEGFTKYYSGEYNHKEYLHE